MNIPNRSIRRGLPWQTPTTRYFLVASAMLVAGLALAQSGLVLSSKALGYREELAELWAALDASGNPDSAIRLGEISSDGRFRLELPATLPPELLSAPDVREDCGDATAGLKLAALTEVFVQREGNVVGQMFFANRRAPLEQLFVGESDGSIKVGYWFYANRAGSIIEDCRDADTHQVSKVNFVQGWNEVTGFILKKAGKLETRILNGHTQGLQRWFFQAAPQ